MEWINNIFILIGVALGWGFSQVGEYFKDKKDDKKKLKKLLFNLLEIRYLLCAELGQNKMLDKSTFLIKKRFKDIIGEDLPDDDMELRKVTRDIFKTQYDNSDKIILLGNNIDNILIDLSEVDPVFAYELSGQYNVKERLAKTENIMRSIEEEIGYIPKELESVLKSSELSNDFIEPLDQFILQLAKRISNKINKQVVEKIEIQNSIINGDNDEVEKFVDDFIDKIKLSIISN